MKHLGLPNKWPAGELPPVEERLPDDLFIVEPVDSIGRYGGVLRATLPEPGSGGDDTLLMSYMNPIQQSPDLSEFVPHVLRDFVMSEDATTWTMHMRRGMRHSDGHPFTADDIMFWYESILMNEDLTPHIGDTWRSGDEVVTLSKIDDYTIDWEFAERNPFFVNLLVHAGRKDFLVPKHFLKNYHPDYVSEEELAAMARDAGFENWYQHFGHVNNVQGSGQSLYQARPTLSAWILKEETSERRIWEPNPYFWKVDSEGNQLPYLAGIEGEIVGDSEVVQGMLLSGDLDFVGFRSDIRNYPLYQQYQDEGEYVIKMWESVMTAEVVYMFNMTHDNPVLAEVFGNPDFRRAMSMAIDRQEISDIVYFGQAKPQQYTILETSAYYEPGFSEAYAQYDPEQADALLDSIGLDERDSSGFRLLPDGERLAFTIEVVDRETPKMPNVELVTQQWQDVGVDARFRVISGELARSRAPGNLMDATVWHGDKASDVVFPIRNNLIIPMAPGWDHSQWPAWGQWLQTDGAEGQEPPPEIKEIRQWYEAMLTEPDDDERIRLGKQILAAQAENLWVIGTVGSAPYPVIVNKDIRNIPETGLWGWDSLWTQSRSPEQIYFDR